MKSALHAAAAVLALTATSLVASSAHADGNWMPFPLCRLSIGGRVPVTDDPRVDQGLAMEAALGATLTLGRKNPLDSGDPEFQLSPHIGVTTGPNTIAFAAGMGIGGGVGLFSAAYEPQLIAGKWTGPNTGDTYALVGMRNSVTLGVFFNIISLEVGHEFSYYADGIRQSAVVLGRLDLGALLPAIIIAAMSGMN
ncbi:MAG: hypothetical protein U0271_17390 [Polyangiaceae bacterium]